MYVKEMTRQLRSINASYVNKGTRRCGVGVGAMSEYTLSMSAKLTSGKKLAMTDKYFSIKLG